MNDTSFETEYDWNMKDGLLTFVDTGEQWEVPHWTDADYAEFLALPHGDKCGLIEGLE